MEFYADMHLNYEGFTTIKNSIAAFLVIDNLRKIYWFRRIRIENDQRPPTVNYYPRLAPISLEAEWEFIIHHNNDENNHPINDDNNVAADNDDDDRNNAEMQEFLLQNWIAATSDDDGYTSIDDDNDDDDYNENYIYIWGIPCQ
ncbi:hypothetical protein PV325_006211, partial [Microctonus aethiopoides]